jgi:hypothetical protein
MQASINGHVIILSTTVAPKYEPDTTEHGGNGKEDTSCILATIRHGPAG